MQCGQNHDYLEAVEKYVNVSVRIVRPNVIQPCRFRSLTMISERIVNIFYHPDFIYKRTQRYRTERKYFDISQALPNKVLRLNELIKKNSN